MKISSVVRILNRYSYFENQFKSCNKIHALNTKIINRANSNVSNINLDNLEEIKLNNVSLNKYLTKIEERYNTISYSIDGKYKKEKTELLPIINCLNQRREILKNIQSLGELQKENDIALQELVRSDLRDCAQALKKIEDELISSLFIKSPEDECKDILFEVNSGVGGQEAMLFAKELFEMYQTFAIAKGK